MYLFMIHRFDPYISLTAPFAPESPVCPRSGLCWVLSVPREPLTQSGSSQTADGGDTPQFYQCSRGSRRDHLPGLSSLKLFFKNCILVTPKIVLYD